MTIWLQCYAFLWMILSGYTAYGMLDPQKRIKRADDMEENGHIYESMMAAISPHIMVGVLTAMELFVVAVDLYGFWLAFFYVPLVKWQTFLFGVVVLCYLTECMRNFSYLKKFKRAFEKPNPFRILARYLRRTVTAAHPSAYVASYGKCFASVKLFLAAITPGVAVD